MELPLVSNHCPSGVCFPLRNLFLVAHATDVSWAAAMADSVRESVLAEAAAVEEESGHSGGDGERDVASGIATLSVTVRSNSPVYGRRFEARVGFGFRDEFVRKPILGYGTYCICNC